MSLIASLLAALLGTERLAWGQTNTCELMTPDNGIYLPNHDNPPLSCGIDESFAYPTACSDVWSDYDCYDYPGGSPDCSHDYEAEYHYCCGCWYEVPGGRWYRSWHLPQWSTATNWGYEWSSASQPYGPGCPENAVFQFIWDKWSGAGVDCTANDEPEWGGGQLVLDPDPDPNDPDPAQDPWNNLPHNVPGQPRHSWDFSRPGHKNSVEIIGRSTSPGGCLSFGGEAVRGSIWVKDRDRVMWPYYHSVTVPGHQEPTRYYLCCDDVPKGLYQKLYAYGTGILHNAGTRITLTVSVGGGLTGSVKELVGPEKPIEIWAYHNQNGHRSLIPGTNHSCDLPPCGPLFTGDLQVRAAKPLPDWLEKRSVVLTITFEEVTFTDYCCVGNCQSNNESSPTVRSVTTTVTVKPPTPPACETCGLSMPGPVPSPGKTGCFYDRNEQRVDLRIPGLPPLSIQAGDWNPDVHPRDPKCNPYHSESAWPCLVANADLCVGYEEVTTKDETWDLCVLTHEDTFSVTKAYDGEVYVFRRVFSQTDDDPNTCPHNFPFDGDYTYDVPLLTHYRLGSPPQPYAVAAHRTDGRLDYVYDPVENGVTVHYDYTDNLDDKSYLVKVRVASTQAAPLAEVGYNASGVLTHIAGGCSACGIASKDYHYDTADRLTATTDAYGAVVERNEYDNSCWQRGVTRRSAGSGGDLLVRSQDAYDYDYTARTFRSFVLTKYIFEDNSTTRVRLEEHTSSAMDSPTRVYEYEDFGGAGAQYVTEHKLETSIVGDTTHVSKTYDISHKGVTQVSQYDTNSSSTSFGRVVTKTMMDANGQPLLKPSAVYEYDSDPNQTGVTRMTREIDARGGNRDYEYGPLEVKDQYGTTVLTLHGFLTKQVEPAIGTDRLTHRYEYDARRRVTNEWKQNGATVGAASKYEYDWYDNLTLSVEADGSPLAATMRYEYDLFNRQTKAFGPYSSTITNYTTKVYADGGALLAEAVIATGTTAISEKRYEYDANARLTKDLVADSDTTFTMGSQGSEVTWITTTYHYDSIGRQTAVVQDAGEDGLNLTTSYEYNNQDEIVKTTTPGGVWTQTIRNGRGLQKMQIVGFQGSTPATEITTQYWYDEDANLTKTKNLTTSDQTLYVYDGFGRRTKTIKEVDHN